MARLFEKARRLYIAEPHFYARVLVCQRIYQEMVSSLSVALPTAGSASNFASIPAGPMHAQASSTPQNPDLGATSPQIASEGREFLREFEYRGMMLKPGDWVHLINPADASKPIVGLVWKIFTKAGRRYVCENASSSALTRSAVGLS